MADPLNPWPRCPHCREKVRPHGYQGHLLIHESSTTVVDPELMADWPEVTEGYIEDASEHLAEALRILLDSMA